jgi:hypothetical protein
MTRTQLLGTLQFAEVTSSPAAYSPSANSGVPAGFVLIGGFRINWQPGQGNLATTSFPEFGNVWTARAQDHFVSSPCTIDSFAIGLRSPLPAGVGAEVRWNRHGSLLWQLNPTVGGTQQGVTAASKDHQVSSPAIVKAWAIGIRLV